MNIRRAFVRIDALKGTRIVKRSRLIESEPVGRPAGQPRYLNAAVKVQTSLTARALLSHLRKIENSLGRKRSVRGGARTIDLDILFYGGLTLKSRALTIPHPRAFERLFVVKPLQEVL